MAAITVFFYDIDDSPSRADAPSLKTYDQMLCSAPGMKLGSVYVKRKPKEYILGIVALDHVYDMVPAINLTYLIKICLKLLRLDEEQATIYIHVPDVHEKYFMYTNHKNYETLLKNFSVKLYNVNLKLVC